MQKIDILDFHIHSKFSIPSSKSMDIKEIVQFARKKGITVLGTGDILLNEWRRNIERNFEFNSGFYHFEGMRFILTGEVNIVFEQFNALKRFHVVVAFRDFKSVDEFKKAFN